LNGSATVDALSNRDTEVEKDYPLGASNAQSSADPTFDPEDAAVRHAVRRWST